MGLPADHRRSLLAPREGAQRSTQAAAHAIRMNGSRPTTTTLWFTSERDAKLAFGTLAVKLRRQETPGHVHLERLAQGEVVEEIDLQL
jgi:hypothetical protein